MGKSHSFPVSIYYFDTLKGCVFECIGCTLSGIQKGRVVGSVPVYCGAFKQGFAWKGFVQYWFFSMQEDTGQAAYIRHGA